MLYSRLGETGLIVSRLAFGALTFTAGDRTLGSVYKVDEGLAERMVGRALDAGVTFFDTADVYADGESETLLGRALKPHRDRVVIGSKVGNRVGRGRVADRSGLSRRHILWSVDETLRRLGTDRLDLYVAHREDPFTPLEETLEAFDAVVRAGKVRYLGFSNWSAWKAATAVAMQRANGWARFTHGQMYYSLLGRELEHDLLPMLAHHGLGLTVWSPLAYGFLSGRYTREDLADPQSRLNNFGFLDLDADKAFALIDVMRGIAGAHGRSLAQVAIAWLLARPQVTSVILGASKIEQLDDNLAAAGLRLEAADLAALEAATAVAAPYPTAAWAPRDRVTEKMLGPEGLRAKPA